MFVKNNTDKVSKEMQISGLKETLKSLKNLEVFSRYDVEPILKTIKNILSCYNCIPNKCLKKRINHLLSVICYPTELKMNVKSLIVEIETLLESNNEDIKKIDETESPI